MAKSSKRTMRTVEKSSVAKEAENWGKVKNKRKSKVEIKKYLRQFRLSKEDADKLGYGVYGDFTLRLIPGDMYDDTDIWLT